MLGDVAVAKWTILMTEAGQYSAGNGILEIEPHARKFFSSEYVFRSSLVAIRYLRLQVQVQIRISFW